ncbi:hypothetical protein [uncultured Roseibium sp.]|uniref:hypothetical protein n=1 Tax=uncultured Roseibium sp. TaxID=1936171 RepID=UPI002604325D|nr:hypothetical protein [uncultured Roseibium sp.]
MRHWLTLLILTFAGPVLAQDDTSPIVRSSLEQNTAIPGQPLIYRISVLVPTWLPSLPVFPSIEVPNVAVRLPPRASGPISDTIDGETWSGVARSYRLYPMTVGRFEIPAGLLKVTYADPQTSQPVVVDAQTEAFEIIGKLPQGADTLKPFLAARKLTLDRTIDGLTNELRAGDSLSLSTSVSVSGVLPMFVPPLTPDETVSGLVFYPKEPVLEEGENRGIVEGIRSEEVTVMLENAGSYRIGEFSMSWYNLESGKFETSTVPAIEFDVAGTVPANEPVSESFNTRSLLSGVLAIMVVAAFFVLFIKVYGHPLLRWIKNRLNGYKLSEFHAYRMLRHSVRSRDYPGTLMAIAGWKERIGRHCASLDMTSVDDTLYALGKSQFENSSNHGSNRKNEAWKLVLNSVSKLRQQARIEQRKKLGSSLKALNPT